jgi:NAD(P)-dependent dehydrogenase (short-subunit alcohol dehydrogenase family)
VKETFGKLDILFINAVIAQLAPVEVWDEAGWNRTFDINVKGPYFLIQALLPVLGNPASIILNTSINARIGMPTSSVYSASKAALISLARTLSGELIGRGIRVNAVSPGPTDLRQNGPDGRRSRRRQGGHPRPDPARPLRHPGRGRQRHRPPRLPPSRGRVGWGWKCLRQSRSW